jgi:hypothetical protein
MRRGKDDVVDDVISDGLDDGIGYGIDEDGLDDDGIDDDIDGEGKLNTRCYGHGTGGK